MIKSSIESNVSQKIPYPKRVFFIIGSEFFERFSYYGVRSILVLYLNGKLGYNENDSTVTYHAFVMSNYFMCIFGGIVSDVWLGKFKTIFFLSIIYLLGNVIVWISSIPIINISPNIFLILGLIVISTGSGGIKPCVNPFGGDQFKLPEQSAQINTFFSMFYLSISLAQVISTVISPIFRADVHCFGDNDCYPLAFGMPVVFMSLSITLFLIGSRSYTRVEVSSENMLIQVTKCITNAIAIKIREGHKHPGKKLLDFSIEKYGEQLVNDIRSLLRLLVLYIPLPLFWTLLDQRSSRWTFQATKMNGNIGFYTIKPDQIQMLSPTLVFIFIPTFAYVIYPIIKKIGIRKPPQKMILGGFAMSIAFLFATAVQYKIESSPDKSVHMLWLIPQYIFIAIGQAMFEVTGVSFSYEQAPKSMKSVVMAMWCLTVAVGSIITMIITKSVLLNSRIYESLLFSGIMFVDMLIFMFIAYKHSNGTNNPNSHVTSEK